ncbi:protein disulfide isomerase-like 1-6 isoform X2 [Abrus precatorius]|uniref:Protein disulfide isomerase-like 1-6 isoform X2 n=1 Tax=Abrus precatorius TaxID=3816 RepID=A0A8B8KN68_ABRPR|nr:protein disulfide isomerase-like 1-6 isoform X2 [Abrus precatorius]
MSTRKPTLRFIYLLLILLVLSFNVVTEGSEAVPGDKDEDDLEELLAVDDEVEQEAEGGGVKLSEAEVLTKAQRIVLELNNDNTERVVNGNEFVLVLGYAPWCPRSAELMPHFAEAATSLKDLGTPLLMAKLDADRYPKPAKFLGVKGFPTLLLFVNGTSQPYSGGFTADDIVTWARKKTGTLVIRIGSVAEAEEFLKKYQTFLIGRFDKFEGPDYDEFVSAAKSDNETQFVEVSKVELAQVLYPDIKGTDRFLGIVKSEPERYTAYVFANTDDFKNLLDPLQDVARTFKSKIMFIHVDINDENLAKPFLTLFGLEESKNTVVAAFDNGMSSKYLLESKPTRSNIEEFCNSLVQGSLSPYFKSQPIPDNTEASVHVIVGKTFDDEILGSTKNVLLEVFTPWCINCDAISKQVDKLSKHYKGSSTLIFARIDASTNEHPKLQVNDYPTLLLYRSNDKTNPIKLSTKSSLKELAASINKHLKVKNQVVKDEL